MSNLSKIASQLDALLAEDSASPSPEEGWMTTEGWMGVWGCGPKKARQRIRVGLRHGLMEMQKFKVEDMGGTKQSVPFYRVKQEED